jgi:RHS repeat-associated protein
VVDSWVWDAPYATGALYWQARAVNSVQQKVEYYDYDTLARRTRTRPTLLNGANQPEGFVDEWLYDAYYGRPKQHTYPSGDRVWLRYSKYGQLNRESDVFTGADYRQVGTINGRGEVTQETLGGIVSSTYAYTATTGQMTQALHSSGGQTLRQLSYGYDVFGNVLSQSNGQTSESYTYDPLFRMSAAVRSGAAPGNVSYTYDAAGNFTSKTDYSQSTAQTANPYSYFAGSNKIASVVRSTGVTQTYGYDPNGNLNLDSAGFRAYFDVDNRPTYAQRGAASTTIAYGPDGERFRETGSDGTRLYVGSFERWSSTAETKAYLGDYAVITNGPTGKRVDYLLKDRLGSVDAIAGSTGTLKESRGYDAFGAPRTGTWADSPTGIALATTEKGFTEHEHLNAVALIHMRGRAYDYRLGRFLSVDPIVQAPLNSQSVNPYSYLLNNPLSGTDPTGYAPACAGGGNDCNIELKDIDRIEVRKDGVYARVGNDTYKLSGYTAGSVSSNGANTVFTSFAQTRPGPGGMASFGSLSSPRPEAVHFVQSALTKSRLIDSPVQQNSFGSYSNGRFVFGDSFTADLGRTAANLFFAGGENEEGNDAIEEWGSIPIPQAKAVMGLKAAGGILLASLKVPIHHIATNKAFKSGFTRQFEQIFKRAGITLEDAANKVPLPGHTGPHARAYHEYVLARLRTATDGLRGAEYGAAVRTTLAELKTELLRNPDLIRGVGLP